MLDFLKQNAGLVEQYAVSAIVVGALIVLIGYFWLVRRGFAEGWGWGFAALIPPFQLLFWYRKPKEATLPWLVILLGAIVIGGTIAAVHYVNIIDLGERERIIDGKRYLGLTDWDKDDYSILKEKKDTAILQMRNKDVNDEVIALLAGFEELEELDIGDTSITDESLKVLANLPKLRDLKMDNTAITDAGFREHLLKKESLMKLDMERMDSKTGVKSKSMRDWKNAKKGRDYLHTFRKVPK
jgi:hypothetical protein